ncbi:MAG TPA: type II toxin-antitoxin system HicA family toxin [bacterium]|nr:type II toxin-antitoxin system HicA family toxin [bacterium]HMW33150.1 type II toxin-antitoxin system HicA family toxin [bacterium]HMW37082.1 type II toxin-antitoxin system HicA family toxin [bacterium]HMY36769.1 type II toxin-antitoxin system HicA family toxin [bacterium]HMZ05234.1 type II toxin-antitoxin system HicA family toxin [bacterium]
MSKLEKILLTVLRGTSDTNIDFEDLRKLLHTLGFSERIKGSHHIFYKDGVVEIINLQSKNSKAKPYQVKQVRNLIIKYKLGGDENG